MKEKSSTGKKKLHGYRAVIGLGIGLGSIVLSVPAHASVPIEGCSEIAAQSSATFSTVPVSREVAFLRQFHLTPDIGFGQNKLLAATCTGTCNPDGSGSYSQEPGCTYTQTCGGGGGTKKTLQAKLDDQVIF